MTEYAICFDFPEAGDPWFAAKLKDGLGWTTSLADAERFESEDAAERVLTNMYGDGWRPFGAVVEVGK